jgi:5-methylcytosine-specific restriction endonuclease McrA
LTYERKALTKKQRFNVFKRDHFTCQYCGQTPPAVVLEVDHITPVVEGGSNDILNLLTACFDCNRGKGKDGLESVPETVAQRAEVL